VSEQREYPSRPIVGVGGVIVAGEQVVLIKRGSEPLKGRWNLPGGVVEVGETLHEALVRELLEETGLEVEVGPVIEVFDRITRDADGRVRFHYVLVDYLCWPVAGTLRAGSDVDDARWAQAGNLAAFDVTDKAAAVVTRAMELHREGPGTIRQ
jgi:ADP-ribose pyrophosphatase YjhB (NUDIX family)